MCTICFRMSGDDTGGRDTSAAGEATVSKLCRNPARNHDVYRSVEPSISTVTVYILLWDYCRSNFSFRIYNTSHVLLLCRRM
jgi:hypothetical protein